MGKECVCLCVRRRRPRAGGRPRATSSCDSGEYIILHQPAADRKFLFQCCEHRAQPEDNKRSEAVSLIFRGFTANYVSIKRKTQSRLKQLKHHREKLCVLAYKRSGSLFGGLALGCSHSLGSYKSYKKIQHVLKNNPDLNSVVLCRVCVSWQLAD